MIPEVIRAMQYTGTMEDVVSLLQELTAQIAERNELIRRQDEMYRSFFVQFEKIAQIFDPPVVEQLNLIGFPTKAVAAALDPYAKQLVEFVKTRGYNDEAARTIVGNHRAAVAADFELEKAKGSTHAEEEKGEETATATASAPESSTQ